MEYPTTVSAVYARDDSTKCLPNHTQLDFILVPSSASASLCLSKDPQELRLALRINPKFHPFPIDVELHAFDNEDFSLVLKINERFCATTSKSTRDILAVIVVSTIAHDRLSQIWYARR